MVNLAGDDEKLGSDKACLKEEDVGGPSEVGKQWVNLFWHVY